MVDIATLWQTSSVILQERVSKEAYDTWFNDISIENISDYEAIIRVPNRFFRDWIRDHYQAILEEVIGQVAEKRGLRVAYTISGPETQSKEPLREVLERTPVSVSTRGKRLSHLNPRYVFSTFVAASNNQLVRAACLKVAESPATSYNPLLIYGGVGLGKTHLMHAIGNFVLEHTDLRIAYVTSEQFTNEVINGIRYDKMIDVRRRYRNIDMLLVDDIQFIAGKQATQEEFFHTFNSLYEARKQIVVSSDRYPKDMPEMEERLRSRLEWGLVADIQPYPLEARIAILQDKADREGIAIPNDVAHFVANNIKANIRELEGSLVRLGAYSQLTGQTITLEMAQNVLKELINERKRVITLDAVQEVVAEKFHIKISEMKSKRRTRVLVYPRQIAMFLCREITQQSYPEIARHFGGKDHTTVMHACKQIEKAKQSDPGMVGTLEELKRQITGA
ncbi:MAG: chromosomal replication initiator protein DnaA [Nitrospiraceae bacterium]|nr:MAG: chromosomal replication initiator protein DnaA [Nitrospiraceae bacterium]